MDTKLFKLYLCFAIFRLSVHKIECRDPDNLTTDNVMVLVGSTEMNLTNMAVDYQPSINLFKLKSEAIFSGTTDNKSHKVDLRQSRKVNFVGGMWGTKPKVSPLYLINGTVCRFINSSPICTTLATTGIIPSNNSSSLTAQSGEQFGGNGSGQQITFQNQQNQGFVNQQQRQQSPQQPRPSAILDDDSQDINVESNGIDDSKNSTVKESFGPAGKNQHQRLSSKPSTQFQRPATMRPGLAFARRPLNLLTLRRPLRFSGDRN